MDAKKGGMLPISMFIAIIADEVTAGPFYRQGVKLQIRFGCEGNGDPF